MDFCDLDCEYAEWPETSALDGSGSCMTFQAVFCSKKERYVHKNLPCGEKKNRRETADES